MRIITFILSSLFLISVVAVIGFLAGREALLLWGGSMVKESASTLQAISRRGQEYVVQCRQKGSPLSAEILNRLQLRFVNSHEYVLEVICDQFPLDPIVIEKKTLPPFVQKTPGSSGIIWGKDRSGLELEVLGRKTEITVDNEDITSEGAVAGSWGTGPISSCQGFGYMCCQAETQQGVGDVYDQVNDCPRTCYAQCTSRPVVLSFASDPFPEDQSRAITVTPGTSVSFSYVVSPGADKRVTVNLDYGDGHQDTSTKVADQLNHVYACDQNKCTYVARVHVTNGQGVESADTPVTTISVIVQQ